MTRPKLPKFELDLSWDETETSVPKAATSDPARGVVPPSQPPEVVANEVVVTPRPASSSPGATSDIPRASTAPTPTWIAALAIDAPEPEHRSEAPEAVAAVGPSLGRERSRRSGDGRTSHGDASERSRNTKSEALQRGLCAFWLSNRCFALDVELVGEVVQVETVAPVPQTAAAVLGLFNLRGVPVPLVDLAAVLDFEASPQPTNGIRTALVLRLGDLVVGALIERMDTVLASGRETITLRSPGDTPLAVGFVEPRERPGLTVTVLEPAIVRERLEQLKRMRPARASRQS